MFTKKTYAYAFKRMLIRNAGLYKCALVEVVRYHFSRPSRESDKENFLEFSWLWVFPTVNINTGNPLSCTCRKPFERSPK